MNIKQAVAFALLMQNNGGILDKAPSYVYEKLHLCETLKDPGQILDDTNTALFGDYMNRWLEGGQ